MKNISDRWWSRGIGGGMAIDTSFVLFFLALEYGRSVNTLSLEGIVMGATLLMVLILPYYLPTSGERPSMSMWITGRALIAGCGALLGLAYSHSVWAVLPEAFSSIPLTLLILASMISCYIQFYGLMKLRLAK